MLVAQRMQAKRDKVRSRKQRLQGDVEYQEGSRDGQPVNTAHKKVSFLWRSRALDYHDILQTHSCCCVQVVQSAAVLTRGGY